MVGLITTRQNEEQTVISMSILYPDIFKQLDFLESDDFYFNTHKRLWSNMLEMQKQNITIDCVSLHTFLRKNEKTWSEDLDAYIQVLYTDTFNFKSVPYIKMAKAIRLRRLEDDLANNPDLEHAKILFMEIDRLEQEKTDIYTMEQALALWTRKYDTKDNGILTGYPKLDKHISGMNSGDLIVVSARPSIGKSTFVLNIAYNCAKNKVSTMYINLEMNVNSIVSKIMGISTSIETNKFRDKQLNQHEAKTVMNKGIELIKETFPLKIVDVGSITITEIRQIVKEQQGLQLLIIDQLTKIRPEMSRNRKDLEIADATFALKELAKEFKIPIILVHQTNRAVESRDEKMPTLSDLKDSSAVEQDADVVIFLNRESYYKEDENDNTMEIKIAKNKMGECGFVKYLYNRRNSQIIEIQGGI